MGETLPEDIAPGIYLFEDKPGVWRWRFEVGRLEPLVSDPFEDFGDCREAARTFQNELKRTDIWLPVGASGSETVRDPGWGD